MELEEFGFTVVPVLGPETLEAVREIHRRVGPAPDDPQLAINWTFHSTSDEHKQAVKQEVLELVKPCLDEILEEHDVYLTTFITKWPGPDSAFAPHQDPSLVDERRFTGVTVWIPLSDTGVFDGRDNGMLHMVPGSHRFSRGLRVSDVDRSPFADHSEAIIRHHGVGVPMAAGEALIFDNGVIHYSMPNESDEARVVLSFGVRPRESACVLLRQRETDIVDIYEIPDDFYIDVLPAEQHLWEPPTAPIASVLAVHERWTSEELDALCRSVGPAPRTVPSTASGDRWRPSVFCAMCGSSEGLSETERVGRTNAQLVCPSCRSQLIDEGAGTTVP